MEIGTKTMAKNAPIEERELSVLIIDDDHINNFICEKVLRKLSKVMKIESFINPAKALEYLAEQAKAAEDQLPDIIFLDLNMPLMDGWEFLATYRETAGHAGKRPLFFILSSTISDTEIIKAQKHDEVADFVPKPLNKENAEKAIKQYFSLNS